jgi:hypothetical protein
MILMEHKATVRVGRVLLPGCLGLFVAVPIFRYVEVLLFL